MSDQKHQIETPVSEGRPQTTRNQTESIADPIAREEMSDAMGTEWDLRLAKNDGAAPTRVDGLSTNPLSLGLASALDETLGQELSLIHI